MEMADGGGVMLFHAEGKSVDQIARHIEHRHADCLALPVERR